MTAEPRRRMPLPRVFAGALAATLLAGCASLFPPSDEDPEPAPLACPEPPAVTPEPVSSPEPADCDCPDKRDESLESLWIFHRATRSLSPAALARERAAVVNGAVTPLAALQQALLASRPPGGNLPRSLSLLDAVVNTEHREARPLQPVARMLAEQLLERQRLEATNERLTLQLERTGQQLKESQRQADQLREKLEALAEIERTLPGRPPAAAPAEAPAPPPERRTPQ